MSRVRAETRERIRNPGFGSARLPKLPKLPKPAETAETTRHRVRRCYVLNVSTMHY
jgi:hypothetical protein